MTLKKTTEYYSCSVVKQSTVRCVVSDLELSRHCDVILLYIYPLHMTLSKNSSLLPSMWHRIQLHHLCAVCFSSTSSLWCLDMNKLFIAVSVCVVHCTLASSNSVLLVRVSACWSLSWNSLGVRIAGAKKRRKKNPLMARYFTSCKDGCEFGWISNRQR